MRKQRIYILLYFLILTGTEGLSQNLTSLGPWHISPLHGELSARSQYRIQESYFNNITETQNSLYFIGGIKIRSDSYLWKRDILLINLDAEFNPETRDEKYLLIPDRSEVRTLKKLNLQTSLFSGKDISLITYANLNQNYYNRELLTNIQSDSRQFGGVMTFKNKYLPLNLSYRNTGWDQLETLSERRFRMDQDNIRAEAGKSFGERDKHRLIWTNDHYKYSYADLHEISNMINRIRLNNMLYFDEDRKHNFNSNIGWHDQKGNYSFKRIEADERLIFRLPNNFRINGNYNYFRLHNENYLLSQHRSAVNLNHRLFESLNSDLWFEYSTTGHDLYQESNIRSGFSLAYTKKIARHRLNISYKYYLHKQDMESDETRIEISNEEITLSDTEIKVLSKSYADISSVVIRDLNGTTIYQEGLDYLLLQRNVHIEVERVPGGQIADNQTVLADYTAIQPGAYNYIMGNNHASISFAMFNNLFEFYYRGAAQEYPVVIDTEYLTLNRYYQNITGARFNLAFASGGIEFDHYRSNLIPYKRISYYLNLNHSFRQKLIVAVNSTIRDYTILDTETEHLYANIAARAAYNISPKSRINLEISYLNQTGKGIDLDLMTMRSEFVTSYRKLFFKMGIRSYSRKYLSSRFVFYGTYIELTRKF